MKKLFTVCLLAAGSFSLIAQSESTYTNFTNIRANGSFSNGFGTSTLNLGNVYKISHLETPDVNTDGYLQIQNVASGKSFYVGPNKMYSDIPMALGGNKIRTGFQLSINGKFVCTEGWVQPVGNWPDYVFSKEYNLPSLASVEQFISINSHLPEVPSASEVKQNGINIGDMDAVLLRKIEEMTLYMIQANKDITKMQEEISRLKDANEYLQQQLNNK